MGPDPLGAYRRSVGRRRGHADLEAIWHGRKRFWPSVVSGPALYAGWLADRAFDRISALTDRTR